MKISILAAAATLAIAIPVLVPAQAAARKLRPPWCATATSTWTIHGTRS